MAFVPPHLRNKREGSNQDSSNSSQASSNRFNPFGGRSSINTGTSGRPIVKNDQNFPSLAAAIGSNNNTVTSSWGKRSSITTNNRESLASIIASPSTEETHKLPIKDEEIDHDIIEGQNAMEEMITLQNDSVKESINVSEIVKKDYKQKLKVDEKLIEIKPVEQVTLSGNVITKIIQHCKQQDNSNSNNRNQQDQTSLGGNFIAVSGQLLGIDNGSTLEVTDSFPFYISNQSNNSYNNNNNNNSNKNSAAFAALNAIISIESNFEENRDEESSEYLKDMLNCLSEINYDSNPIGWYISTNMGSFWSHYLLEAQFHYQKLFPQAIVLVHDTTLTNMGNLNMRAFRLSNEFMAMYEKERNFTMESIVKGKLNISSILEIVPITIHNSSLHGALLQGLESQSSEFPHDQKEKLNKSAGISQILESISPLSINSSILDLGFDQIIEKQLENVTDALEIHDKIQWRWQSWSRKIAKDKQRIQNTLNRFNQDNLEAEKRQAHLNIKEIKLPHSKEEIANIQKQLDQLMSSEPNRLESLIIVNQLATYCNQITQTAGPALTKMYIAKE